MDQMCRTCLATSGDFISIFTDDYYVRNLPAKLLHTTKIEVTRNDSLPKVMCKKCIFLVDSFYCFQDQCDMADIKLKKSLGIGLIDDIIYSTTSYNDTPQENNEASFLEERYPEKDETGEGVSNSDEDYQVEYISEEARLFELEKAKRKKHQALKRMKKSGVKVKSVEILPQDKKEDILKNLNAVTHNMDNGQKVVHYNEERYMVENENDEYADSVSPPMLNEMSNADDIKENGSSENYTSYESNSKKRKADRSNSTDQLQKVPKRVMFKEPNEKLTDSFIEMSESSKDSSMLFHHEPVQDDKVDESESTMNYDTERMPTELQSSDAKVVEESNHLAIHNIITNSRISILLQNLYVNEKPMMITELAKKMEVVIQTLSLNFPDFCSICTESFDSYCAVLKHKIENHITLKQEQYFCPVCHERFFSKVDLVEHLNEHSDIHSFTCLMCASNFYTDESLVSHLTTHVDIKEMRCKDCFKKFVRLNNFKYHLETHLTPEKLTCNVCSNSYTSKLLLQNHIYESHTGSPNTEDKFKCETCGTEVLISEKDEHMRSHNGYPCPYCERTFVVKTILRDHVFSHLGVKQYTCLVCEKTFVNQTERTIHMQEHMKVAKPDVKYELIETGKSAEDQVQDQASKTTEVSATEKLAKIESKKTPQRSDTKKFRCRVCHKVLMSRTAYAEHLKELHMNSKQSSEILKELSERIKSESEQSNQEGNISNYVANAGISF